MKVGDVMTRFVHAVNSSATIGEAAQIMGLFDVGILPVLSADEEVIGVVTDRDLVVRGLADGLHPGTAIPRVMTAELCFCGEGDNLQQAVAKMADCQIRRLLVLSKHNRLLGIVSLADCVRRDVLPGEVSLALRAITRPDGDHSQRLRVA